MNKEQFVKNIHVGDKVNTTFVVVEKKLVDYSSQKRAGEKFMLLRLQDNTGTIKAVLWDNADDISPYILDDNIVWVTGKTQEYKGLQIIIDQIKPLKGEDVDLSYFVPVSSQGLNNLSKKITEQMHNIKNEYLSTLLQKLFSDKKLYNHFIKVPAGKKVHHNYLGGLAEHVLEMIEIMSSMYQLYDTRLNWDLLVTGAILHDIGKIHEYDLSSPSFKMQDKGKLVGHIVLGDELIQSTIKEIPGFPEDLAMELRHMLLSHHGEKEWGSPEIPKTMNALCLFYADLFSSRMNQVNKLILETEQNDEFEEPWTNFDPLLGRAFYLPKPTREFSEHNQITFDHLDLT